MKIQSSIYRDKLELCDSNGELVKELPFTINITALADTVLHKQRQLTKVDQSDLEALGRSFIELLEAIFGKAITDELLDYYQKDYIVMITDLAPGLTQELLPLFDKHRKNAINARKKVKK